MTTQPELELAKIITERGFMRPSSLRPGHWLTLIDERDRCCVIQSSNRTQRVELWFSATRRVVLGHAQTDTAIYHGKGGKRYWWALLPDWLASWFCPFSAPPRQKKGTK